MGDGLVELGVEVVTPDALDALASAAALEETVDCVEALPWPPTVVNGIVDVGIVVKAHPSTVDWPATLSKL